MKRLMSAREVTALIEPGRYAIGHGAYLQISQWKTRSWIFGPHCAKSPRNCWACAVSHRQGFGLGHCARPTAKRQSGEAAEFASKTKENARAFCGHALCGGAGVHT